MYDSGCPDRFPSILRIDVTATECPFPVGVIGCGDSCDGVGAPVRVKKVCTSLLVSANVVHTPYMTLKNVAFLALIGMLLLTLLLAVDFIRTVSGVMNDVVPAMALLRSLVYLLASISVTAFFYVFHGAQSR